MKVLVGVPHGGTVKGNLLTAVVSAVYNAGCGMVLMDRASALGPDNRWHIARAAVETGCTHLWLVDNDMSFPPDTLARLLAHEKDLVGAAYNYRAHPLRTVVKMWDAQAGIVVPTKLPPTLFQCYAIGSGCKLVTTDALRRIPQPWFALDWNPDGSLKVTDDVWFCQQAAKVGIHTWCDPTIPVKHLGDFAY